MIDEINCNRESSRDPIDKISDKSNRHAGDNVNDNQRRREDVKENISGNHVDIR